jgi:hypothetical protein
MTTLAARAVFKHTYGAMWGSHFIFWCCMACHANLKITQYGQALALSISGKSHSQIESQ